MCPLIAIFREPEALGYISHGSIVRDHVAVEVDGPEPMVVALGITIAMIPADGIVPARVVARVGARIVKEAVGSATPFIQPEVTELDELRIGFLQELQVGGTAVDDCNCPCHHRRLCEGSHHASLLPNHVRESSVGKLLSKQNLELLARELWI